MLLLFFASASFDDGGGIMRNIMQQWLFPLLQRGLFGSFAFFFAFFFCFFLCFFPLLQWGLFASDDLQIIVVGDEAAAHAAEMGGLELAVDEGNAAAFEKFGKHDERNLRGIWLE